MERIRRKLKSVRGESLVELLASILIGGLSVSLLATLIITSVHMKKSVQERDKEYYESLKKAEAQKETNASTESVKVEVTIAGAASGSTEIPVTYYGDDNMVSYRIKETGVAGP